MSHTLITKDTIITDAVLNMIAHIPTRSLSSVVSDDVFPTLSDTQFMRIAVLLAQKSYQEGGCPIGGVIIDRKTRAILGKGHNTLVQDNDPYNHGETSAVRDAGRIDFSKTTLFTTLTPCDICATLCYMRGFSRVVIGNSPNAQNNEDLLREKGLQVDLLPDQMGIDLYTHYQMEKPDQDIEDWQGLAALSKSS